MLAYNLDRCVTDVPKKSLKQPALQIIFNFIAMELNEVPGLLLPVAWYDLVR
jgi:hypothetical protein